MYGKLIDLKLRHPPASEGSLHESKYGGRQIVGVSCGNLSERDREHLSPGRASLGNLVQEREEKKTIYLCYIPLGQTVTAKRAAAMVIPVCSEQAILHFRSITHPLLRWVKHQLICGLRSPFLFLPLSLQIVCRRGS